MIDILMATYNGEDFINQQIDSIINQTYKEWKIYIRDDGSKDNTVNIVKDYIKKYPEKIVLIEDSKKGLGAKLNFGELLKYSNGDYCMFSDQDDIWLNTKIENTLSKTKDLESVYGKEIPILVHTDLKVVDSNLNIISDSFWNYQNLNVEGTELNSLLVQNNITGCTMLMNKALIELSRNIPKECVMHDWWIGLIASGLGKIGSLKESTILYRQHGNNEVGAHKYKSIKFIINKAKNIRKIQNSINDSIAQAQVFNRIYSINLDEGSKRIVREFSFIKEKNTVSRKMTVLKNGFYKSGMIRTLSYILFI